MRTVLRSFVLASALVAGCGDGSDLDAPDAIGDVDAATDAAPDARADLIQVSVRHSVLPAGVTVRYWIHDRDGALIAEIEWRNQVLQALDVPDGGSVTEIRSSSSLLRELRTVTGVTDGLTIDFDTRGDAIAGQAIVNVDRLAADARASVGSSCGVTSLDASDRDVALRLRASPCPDAHWIAVTTQSPRQYQVIDAPDVVDGATVRFDGAWQAGGTEEITVTGLPATGSATFFRTLAVGRFMIAGDLAQSIVGDLPVIASAIPGEGLHVIDSVSVTDGALERIWSVRDPQGKLRAPELLPALDAPKIDEGRIEWAVPDGAEAATIAVIVPSGPGLDPFHTSWTIYAAADAGALVFPQPAAGFPAPVGARLTLLDASGVTADQVRVAPRLVEDLDWKAPGAATELGRVRTTSSWSSAD